MLIVVRDGPGRAEYPHGEGIRAGATWCSRGSD